MSRQSFDQRLARRCQEVSGEKYTRCLRVVRELADSGVLPVGPERDLDRIETVVGHMGALDADAQAVLETARAMRSAGTDGPALQASDVVG